MIKKKLDANIQLIKNVNLSEKLFLHGIKIFVEVPVTDHCPPLSSTLFFSIG